MWKCNRRYDPGLSEHLGTTSCEGGRPGTWYGRTKSGWFDTYTFFDWFGTLFLPAIKHLEGTRVIIGNNLSSHFNSEVLRLAEENKVIFCYLPPNSTYLCQPLALFMDIKKYWRQVLEEWKLLYLPKIKKLISGFEKCEMYPYNPQKVLDGLPEHPTEKNTQNAH